MDTNFTAANKEFFQQAMNFIASRGFNNMPTWAEWLDIRGMAKSGAIVAAVKMLRDLTFVKGDNFAIPVQCNANTDFSDFVIKRHAVVIKIEPLSLKEAKSIIDWLAHGEDAFGS